MKTFRQFLEEAHQLQWDYDHEDDSMQNVAHVRGHHVKTTVHNRGDHHEVGFQIDHEFRDRGTVAVEDSPSVVRHVTRAFDHYVNAEKPKTISFSAANSHHKEHFARFAKKLADKHGYNHQVVKDADSMFGQSNLLTRKD